MTSIATGSGGPWLAPHQLHSYVAAKPEHVTKVKSYLLSQGLHPNNIELGPWGDRISIRSTPSQAQTLFRSSQHQQRSSTPRSDSGQEPTHHLSVPASLRHMVTHVYSSDPPSQHTTTTRTHTTQARSANKHRAMSSAQRTLADETPDECHDDLVTPECLRRYYGASHWDPHPVQGKLDIVTLLLGGAGSDEADTQRYLNQFRPHLPNAGSFQLALNVSTHGAEAPGSLGHGSEGFLDIETIAGIAAPLHIGQIKYGSPESLDITQDFTASLRYVLDTYKGNDLPGVISVSFGGQEEKVKPHAAHELCSLVQKLSAQGTTVVFAAGDAGVDGSHGTQAGCKDHWTPPYPSGCPYVLSVGALHGFDPSRATNGTKSFYSGAGFSNIFAQPKYQKDAVQAYVNHLGDTGKGKYNASVRSSFPFFLSLLLHEIDTY